MLLHCAIDTSFMPLQDDDLAVEFVAAASALRSFNYGIPTQSVSTVSECASPSECGR